MLTQLQTNEFPFQGRDAKVMCFSGRDYHPHSLEAPPPLLNIWRPI